MIVLTETFPYAAGDLWTVSGGNWTSFFNNTNTMHCNGSNAVFYHVVPPINNTGDAVYFTGFDCTSGNHCTITVPVKLTRPPTQTTSNNYADATIQIQMYDTNTEVPIASVTITASTDSIGSPSYINYTLTDFDGNNTFGSNILADLNGTLAFDLTGTTLTVSYNSVAQLTATASIDTVLTTTTTPYIYLDASRGSTSAYVTDAGTYGTLTLDANSAGPAIPTDPGSPTASAITTTGATISWAASTGGTGTLTYTVEYQDQTDPGQPWQEATPTTATNLVLTGLMPGTVYGVRVHTTDSLGQTSHTITADALFITLPTGSPIQGMLVVRNVVYPGGSFPLLANPPLTLGPGVTNTTGTVTFPSGSNPGSFTFIVPTTTPTNTAQFSYTYAPTAYLPASYATATAQVFRSLLVQLQSAGSNQVTYHMDLVAQGAFLPPDGYAFTYLVMNSADNFFPRHGLGEQNGTNLVGGKIQIAPTLTLAVANNVASLTLDSLGPGGVSNPTPYTMISSTPLPTPFPQPITVTVTSTGNTGGTAFADTQFSVA